MLDWFADQAGLSLVLDAPPAGTFNYTDTRSYTPAKAIDLLNSVLLTKPSGNHHNGGLQTGFDTSAPVGNTARKNYDQLRTGYFNCIVQIIQRLQVVAVFNYS